jgi:two-component system, sensor histidine kinase and response regulator
MKTLGTGHRYSQRQPIHGAGYGVISTLPVFRGHHDTNNVPLARLLIVDDDGDQVATMCRLLRGQGYSVTGATSGANALDVLLASRADDLQFDILVTDLIMPAMDGIALLRAAFEIDRDLVTIIMTGHGTVDSAVEAMKSGALDYIRKPFSLKIAMPVLSRALAVRRLSGENALLVRQVANHTIELESANRELIAANAQLDAFARSVSHDLRQPISNIIGFAELLSKAEMGPLNERQREFLDYIYNGGKRLLCITEDLLRFSRVSHQPPCKEDVDMEALVQEILIPMQMAEAHRRIELRIDPLPCVRGDRSLLRQAFANLLSNAFKFTRRVSNPVVEISGQLTDRTISYCIRDNGAGFDMAQSQRLFTIFQRLHSDGEFEGTGVGLSIVKRILEHHGGSITAESEIGKGATFTLKLPR